MKKSFNEILNDLEPVELEKLTDGIGEKLDEVTSRRIAEAALAKSCAQKQRTVRNPRKMKRAAIAIAACAALLASIAIGSFAVAEDAKEYREAITFFETNDLSTEGLTRSEIKAVYRDITTESYTYSKTAEVLEHSGKTVNVEGISFPADTDAPADPQAGLDASYARYLSTARYEFSGNQDTIGSSVRFVDSTVSKWVGQEKIWSVTTDKIDAHNAFEISNGVIVSGRAPYEFSYTDEEDFKETAAVMKLAPDGSFIWICTLEQGNVSSVVENTDGSLTVFYSDNDRIDLVDNTLYVAKLDAEGNILSATETPSEQHIWVCDVVPFEDGYIGINYVDDYTGVYESHVVKIDGEGHLLGEYTYSEGGRKYALNDIELFGGRLYISASATEDPYEGYYGDDDWWNTDVSEEEFTEVVKKTHTAVLLVCDTVGGEPRSFYQAEGSLGIELAVTEDGRLEWTINSVYSAKFAPMYGSRAFDARGRIYKLYFAEDGSFIEKVDTGEVTIFWR